MILMNRLFFSIFVFVMPKPSSELLGYFGDQLIGQFHAHCSLNSRDVPACIHKYLEKDFIAISPIVYPKTKKSNTQCQNGEEYERTHHVLMDGPTLQNSCFDLHNVFDCLLEELDYCDSMFTFYQMRHLLYSVKKVIHWLCGTKTIEVASDENLHEKVRIRFLGLLESIQCIECVRTQECVHQSSSRSSIADDVSLWHKILRLEVGLESCKDIKEKMKCLQNEEILPRICGDRATDIHKNLTDLFVLSWCDQAPFTSSHSSKSFVMQKLLLFTSFYFNFLSL